VPILGRPALVALLAVAALGLGGGCALTLSWQQCTVDADCAKLATDGGALFCTTDHLCVGQIPVERLCPETAGSDDSKAIVLATLMEPDIDTPIEDAVKLAVDEINARQQGAGMPPLRLLVCRAADTDTALAAARHAVEDLGARALVGPTTSSTLVGVTAYLTSKDVLAVSPSATAMAITALDDHGLVWRTAPSDGLQADLLVALVQKEAPAPTAVDVVAEDSVYGGGLARAFYAGYHVAGDTTFKGSYSYAADDGAALAAAAAKAVADAPTHALLIADSTAPDLLDLLGNAPALSATRFFLTDSAQNTRLFTTKSGAMPASVLARVRGTKPAVPSGNTYAFFKMSYQNRFGVDPDSTAFVANGYDATYLIALAAAAVSAAQPTGAELAAALSQKLAATGTTLAVGPDSYLDAVQAIRAGPIHLEGASGLLEFDAGSGDRLSPSDGSHLVEVWGVDTSGASPKFVTLPP
jgi:branched-chain amino acid transport system substrate-binding protein